jgi:hypothetical protein
MKHRSNKDSNGEKIWNKTIEDHWKQKLAFLKRAQNW